MQPPAGDEKSVPYAGAPVAMRGGPSGIFVDFDLLPDLLGNASGGAIGDGRGVVGASDSGGVRERTPRCGRDARRSGRGGSDGGRRVALRRTYGTHWPRRTDRRRDVARRRWPDWTGSAGAKLLCRCSPRVWTPICADRGGISIVDLLCRAAQSLVETDRVWARQCPGLTPVEIGAIAHWARVNPPRADKLVTDIVSWRGVAMHRYQGPDPSADVGSYASLHYERISEFYLEHPWLAGKVPLSLGEELALARLLGWCWLLRRRRGSLPLLVLVPPGSRSVG